MQWSESVQEADRIQAEYDAVTTGLTEIRERHDRAKADAVDDRTMTAVTGTLGVLMATGLGLTWVF